jgi:hypothetical protein
MQVKEEARPGIMGAVGRPGADGPTPRADQDEPMPDDAVYGVF